jgi:hypothetical protein
MFVTLLVSHVPMGWLNDAAPANKKGRLVTLLMSQPPIG